MALRTAFKKVLDNVFHPLGLNVERHFGTELALKELAALAKKHQIDLALDVGANNGQFVKRFRRAGFTAQVISFEPLSTAYAELAESAKKDPLWRVFDRCAIGDIDGEIEINVSSNSHSSSILNVSEMHLDAAPSAVYVSKEKTPIRKLDTIAAQLPGKNILLKIDTQGFEDKVIAGARQKLLQRTKIIQLELSLLPLYENAKLFPEMVEILTELNFKPAFYSPGYTDRTNEHIQQIEGYFVRS